MSGGRMTTLAHQPTRAQIADVIAGLRAQAKRYSINDPRRVAIDEDCDQLVDDWLLAES